MRKNFFRIFIGIVVISVILIPWACATPSGEPATPEIASRTSWFSDCIYGIDGISPPLDIDTAGMKPGESWNDLMQRFDVDAMVNEAVETGAGFLTFTLGWGYYTIPFAPYENFLGLAPGEATSTRDLLEEVYQKASKHGIKILVYCTGDATLRRPDLGAKLGFGTPEFFPRWFSMVKWISDKYGDKIDGWWIDGAYETIGYDDSKLLDFSKALRSGNPNAIICFNNGLGPNAFDYRAGADYTAGEIYGMAILPDARFKNGLQWSAFVPMSFQYGQISSAFTTNQIVEYVKNVRAKGGVAYFWIADRILDVKNGAGEYSNKIQIDQLKTLKSVIRDNVPYSPYDAFSEPYKNIEAEDCIRMKSIPNMKNNKMQGALLYSIGQQGSFYQSNAKNTWAEFGKIKLPQGATKFTANVRRSINWYFSETGEYKPLESKDVTMEVRVGGVNGPVIATVGNYNEFDNFNFSTATDTMPLRDRISNFKQISTDVNLAPGEYDIYVTFKGNGMYDYLTEAETIEDESFELANITKEQWLYNKALCYAYQAPDAQYKNKLFNKLAAMKPTINFRNSPIKATEKIYARDFSERRNIGTDSGSGAHMEIIKEPNSSTAGEYMIYLLPNDWIMFKDVNFGLGADKFTTSFVVGPGYGGSSMDIYIDKIYDGVNGIGSTKIGTHINKESADWSNFTESSSNIKPTAGIHNVYIKFNVASVTCGNLEYIRFNEIEIPMELTSNITFMQNGIQGEMLKPGDVDINIHLKNTQAVTRNITVYSVLYNKNRGQILGLNAKSVSIAKENGISEFVSKLTVPDNASDCIIKVFAFDNNISMAPYNVLAIKN